MQALSGIAHQLDQALFDIEMNVFKIKQPGKGAGFNFAADINQGQAFVKINRGGVTLN